MSSRKPTSRMVERVGARQRWTGRIDLAAGRPARALSLVPLTSSFSLASAAPSLLSTEEGTRRRVWALPHCRCQKILHPASLAWPEIVGRGRPAPRLTVLTLAVSPSYFVNYRALAISSAAPTRQTIVSSSLWRIRRYIYQYLCSAFDNCIKRAI
jgi:hypothetical protein